MLDPVILLCALGFGLLFKAIGQPALIGYLAAGFIVHALGIEQGALIHQLASVGEILLLFTIGLKLRFRDLAKPYVYGISLLHLLLITPLLFLALTLFTQWIDGLPQLSRQGTWLLAFGLSFSSTIFAVKIFDEKGESDSLYAVIAIGILVVQDLVAVAYMSTSGGATPDLHALWLLLLIPLKPVLEKFLQLCGHGELLILAGFTLAFGFAALFDRFGLTGDLGALVIGSLVGHTRKRKELYLSLIQFKDLMLIGFFLSIGLYGLPSMSLTLMALCLVGFLIVKPLLFFLLFVAMRLRARTALLSSLVLSNYSEFGLIVGSLAVARGVLDAQWLVMMAVALSLSYLLSSPFNKSAHALYGRGQSLFCRMERKGRLAVEKPAEIGDAKILILGMGRVGQGVYDHFAGRNYESMLGVEEAPDKVIQLKESGYNVIRADGNDSQFWDYLDLAHVHLIMINLTNHEENVSVVSLIRKTRYSGKVAVLVRFPDQKVQLEKMGCIAFNLYAEAGHGFAGHVLRSEEEAFFNRLI